MHGKKKESFYYLSLFVQLSSLNQFIYNTKCLTSYPTLLSITNSLLYFIIDIFHSHHSSFLHICCWEGVANFGMNYSFLETVQFTTKMNNESASLLEHGPSILIKSPSLLTDMQQVSDTSLCLSILGLISPPLHTNLLGRDRTVAIMFPIFNVKILLQKKNFAGFVKSCI